MLITIEFNTWDITTTAKVLLLSGGSFFLNCTINDL